MCYLPDLNVMPSTSVIELQVRESQNTHTKMLRMDSDIYSCDGSEGAW